MLYATNIGDEKPKEIDPKAAAKALRAMKAREARLKKKQATLTAVPEITPEIAPAAEIAPCSRDCPCSRKGQKAKSQKD